MAFRLMAPFVLGIAFLSSNQSFADMPEQLKCGKASKVEFDERLKGPNIKQYSTTARQSLVRGSDCMLSAEV